MATTAQPTTVWAEVAQIRLLTVTTESSVTVKKRAIQLLVAKPEPGRVVTTVLAAPMIRATNSLTRATTSRMTPIVLTTASSATARKVAMPSMIVSRAAIRAREPRRAMRPQTHAKRRSVTATARASRGKIAATARATVSAVVVSGVAVTVFASRATGKTVYHAPAIARVGSQVNLRTATAVVTRLAAKMCCAAVPVAAYRISHTAAVTECARGQRTRATAQ